MSEQQPIDSLAEAEARLAVGVHRELEGIATSADDVARHAQALALIDIAKSVREIRDLLRDRSQT